MNLVRIGTPTRQRELESSVLGDAVVFNITGWDRARPSVMQVTSGAWPSGLVITAELSMDGVVYKAPDAGAVTLTSTVPAALMEVKAYAWLRFRVSTVGAAGVLKPVLTGITEG